MASYARRFHRKLSTTSDNEPRASGCAVFVVRQDAAPKGNRMSNSTEPNRLRPDEWLRTQYRHLQSEPLSEASLDRHVEAELLTVAFADARKATAECVLCLMRAHCDWGSSDRHIVLGAKDEHGVWRRLTIPQIAAMAGVGSARTLERKKGALDWLTRTGALRILPDQRDEFGRSAPHLYFLGRGTLQSQIRDLRKAGYLVEGQVAVVAALARAFDLDIGYAEIRLDQLAAATELMPKTVKQLVAALIKNKRIVCIGPNRFSFANKAWGTGRFAAYSGALFFDEKSAKPKSRGRPSNCGQVSGDLRSGPPIVGEEKSILGSVFNLESNNRIKGSATTAVVTRGRARDAAMTTAARLDVERKRLLFDEFIAKVTRVLNGRPLADLTDEAAYDLLIDMVAGVMTRKAMVDGRRSGLALYRRLARAWPQTTVASQPDMLFREFWFKVESLIRRGGKLTSWGYFEPAGADLLSKYSQAVAAAQAEEFAATMRASGITSPGVRSAFAGAEARDPQPRATTLMDISYANPVPRSSDQRIAADDDVGRLLDGIRCLGLPFADPLDMWSGPRLSNARQALLPRLRQAAEYGLGPNWILSVIAAHRDDERLRYRWSGIGALVDAVLIDEVLGPQFPRHAKKAGIDAFKARLGRVGLDTLIERVRSLDLSFSDAAKAWSSNGRQGAESVVVSRIVRALDIGLDEDWVLDTLAAHRSDPRVAEGWRGVGAMLDEQLLAAFDTQHAVETVTEIGHEMLP